MYTTTQLHRIARHTKTLTHHIHINPRAGIQTYTAVITTPDGTTAGFDGDLDQIFQGAIAHSAPWGADTADVWDVVHRAEYRSHCHHARSPWGTLTITRH